MKDLARLEATACQFYAELAEHNDRRWWEAHRERYREQVQEPLTAVLATLAPRFGPAVLFRPYRDRRFAPPQAPYKEAQGAFASHHVGVGFYLQLDTGGLVLAAGYGSAAPAQVARYRAAVDASHSGATLQDLLASLGAAGYQAQGRALRTVPRGFAPEHPRAELLRFTTLRVAARWDVAHWPTEGVDAAFLAAGWDPLRPLVEWVVRYAAP